MRKERAEFPAIKIEEFATGNNGLTGEVCIEFASGDMQSTLIFSLELAESLLEGLTKSIKRLKERAT